MKRLHHFFSLFLAQRPGSTKILCCENGEGCHHVRERLRRCHGPSGGVDVDTSLAKPSDGGTHHVHDAKDLPALQFDFLQCGRWYLRFLRTATPPNGPFGLITGSLLRNSLEM